MNDEPALDRALDVLLFAPVGLLLAARDLAPELARRGRQQLGSRLTMARVVGQFSVERARKEAGRLTERVRAEAQRVMVQMGVAGDAAHPPGPSDGDGGVGRPPARTAYTGSVTQLHAEGASGTEVPPVAGPSQLAIPGYDSLSASQVIERLAGMSTAELDEIRSYELAGRGRRTILTRIAQLQAGTAPHWP